MLLMLTPHEVGSMRASRGNFETLRGLVRSVPINEKLFIGENLNDHVYTSKMRFKRVHGGFGFDDRN